VAVGIFVVMDDSLLLDRALHGFKMMVLAIGLKECGLIKRKVRKQVFYSR
jgi:hypothetical protein